MGWRGRAADWRVCGTVETKNKFERMLPLISLLLKNCTQSTNNVQNFDFIRRDSAMSWWGCIGDVVEDVGKVVIGRLRWETVEMEHKLKNLLPLIFLFLTNCTQPTTNDRILVSYRGILLNDQKIVVFFKQQFIESYLERRKQPVNIKFQFQNILTGICG